METQSDLTDWDELDYATQAALLDWLNIVPGGVTDDDRERLADLYNAQRFCYCDCAECGSPIRRGTPDNWTHFQGVNEDEGYNDLCADCFSTLRRLASLADIDIP